MNNPERMDPEALKASLVSASEDYRQRNKLPDQSTVTSVIPDQYHMILSDHDLTELFIDYDISAVSYTEFYGDRHE